jgi:trehalose-phosphatase
MLREPRAAVFDLRSLRVRPLSRGTPLPESSEFRFPVAGVDVDDADTSGDTDPAPFLEAARRLGVAPAEAALVGDSPAGIRAGIAGGFAMVVGIEPEGPASLEGANADLVIEGVADLPKDIAAWADLIPPPGQADESLGAIADRLGRAPGIFLDYDGTLTPIVDDPAAATLGPKEREILTRLVEVAPVAVISGRGLDDVRSHVAVEGITYSGSHGFEIMSADGSVFEQPDVGTVVPQLDEAEKRLLGEVHGLPGVMIERKPFAIAVHTRRAETEEARSGAHELAERVGSDHPNLVLRGGKEIIELRPAIDWDKGRAVAYLLAMLPEAAIPLYIGDDETDEDAFAEVRRSFGVGILVGSARGADTWARYALAGTEDVLRFLSLLTEEISRRRRDS